ncbi:hypothetical protein PoB_000052700, partial [Plakobranchus ocellatus]
NPNEPRNQTSVHGDKVTNRFVGLKWPKYDKSEKKYVAISRRPSIRHHYRAEKLALWLDLIPKIDRDDGSGRLSHQLDNSDNSSTFDDYNRLLSSNLDSTIFPSPPPMPPVGPTPSSRSNSGDGTTQRGGGFSGITDENGDLVAQGGRQAGGKRGGSPGGDNSQHGSSRHSSDGSNGSGNCATDNCAGGSDVTKETVSGDGHSGESTTATSGVALSMVVAIGGSLLLINVLIFAGLCYQRERIRKMRRLEKPVLSPPELDYEDEDRGGGLAPASHHNSQKLLAGEGSAQGSPTTGQRRTNASLTSAGAAPECMSLISAGGSSSGGGHHHHHHHHHHHRGPSPLRNNGYQHGNTHIHNPSPQPFADDIKDVGAVGGSGGSGRRNLPYMTRLTPPPLASTESSGSSAVGSAGGSSFVPVTSGGYSSVPTHASSPVHRTHTGPSQAFSGGGDNRTPRRNDPRTLGGGGVGKTGLSGTSTYVNSQIRPVPPPDVPNHTPADIHSRVVTTGPPAASSILPVSGGGSSGVVRSDVPMTTFGIGAGAGPTYPGGSGSTGTASSEGTGSISDNIGGGVNNTYTSGIPGDPVTTTNNDPVYKKINKSGQNNAVTIV